MSAVITADELDADLIAVAAACLQNRISLDAIRAAIPALEANLEHNEAMVAQAVDSYGVHSEEAHDFSARMVKIRNALAEFRAAVEGGAV
jgi:hypothetical protein